MASKTNLPDPTAEEMLSFLLSQPCRSVEDDRDDALVAIYWFASQWHGGQFTNLYSALSTSPFLPGPGAQMETESETVRDMVADLEELFAAVDHGANPCGMDLAAGPVWWLWHGGSSYACPSAADGDAERFETLADALAEFESCVGDSYTPCVSRCDPEAGGPSAQVFFADPATLADPYPDAEIKFNLRGVAAVTEC